MEIVETNAEGAIVHLTRYDLAKIANALEDISANLSTTEIQERVGCDPIDIKRLIEKFSFLYDAVMKASN